jgi:hypothetical protein
VTSRSVRDIVRALFDDFDRTQDSSHVSAALEMLENFSRQASAAAVDRGDSLVAWVDMLTRLDERIDPDWNPATVPPSAVGPPAEHGPVFPSAEIDPGTIADPEERSSYVSRLEATRRARARYTAQAALRQIGHQAVPVFADFIENNEARADLDHLTTTSWIRAAARGEVPRGW